MASVSGLVTIWRAKAPNLHYAIGEDTYRSYVTTIITAVYSAVSIISLPQREDIETKSGSSQFRACHTEAKGLKIEPETLCRPQTRISTLEVLAFEQLGPYCNEDALQ